MRFSTASEILESAINFQIDNRANCRDAQMVVPYLNGGVGIGKTTSVKDAVKTVAQKRGVEMGFTQVNLAEYPPEEVAGWFMPNDDKDAMHRLAPDWLPKQGTYGVLFFDEAAQAIGATQNILSRILNEWCIGEHQIPDTWAIVAAGNRMSDRAGTNVMPTHVRDRLCCFDVEAHLEDTIAYFMANRVHEKLCAFLRFKPEMLWKFDRDANSFPTPRGWERVSSVIGQWSLSPMAERETVSGIVGLPAATEFYAFCAVYDEVPDPRELIKNPETSVIPERPDVLYAVCSALASYATEDNIKAITQYLRRIPQAEFAAFVIKDAASKLPNIKQNPAVRDWVINGGGKEVLV